MSSLVEFNPDLPPGDSERALAAQSDAAIASGDPARIEAAGDQLRACRRYWRAVGETLGQRIPGTPYSSHDG